MSQKIKHSVEEVYHLINVLTVLMKHALKPSFYAFLFKGCFENINQLNSEGKQTSSLAPPALQLLESEAMFAKAK